MSAVVTASAAAASVTMLSGAARPGMKRSLMTCSPSTESGASRNASENGSGSRPPA